MRVVTIDTVAGMFGHEKIVSQAWSVRVALFGKVYLPSNHSSHSKHANLWGAKGPSTYRRMLNLLVRSQLLSDLVDLFSDALGSGTAIAHVVFDAKVIVGTYRSTVYMQRNG